MRGALRGLDAIPTWEDMLLLLDCVMVGLRDGDGAGAAIGSVLAPLLGGALGVVSEVSF